MIFVADSQVRFGWAIKHRGTGQIYLHEICEDEESARALIRGMAKHQLHRREWDIVAVGISVSIIPTGNRQ
jgi:hypothetical protein